ncbi:MAG: gamma-glutamyl-gamma-aminobutyrate hydrolase family protein [Woeseiaceae bacterium]|nr:gamma-glutamyl-gamma-aminobutyrate hydrolase family protein [Woeseiaceae bacterium]
MRVKPAIGVPADRRVLEPHPFHMVGEKYLKALTDGAAALPLIIPVLADELDVDEMLDAVDGVLLTGSPSDIEPHHYDGEPSRDGTLHDSARDAIALPLARRALERGIPLFAVCRGFQELNVALGGSLHQHVAEVPGYHNHKEDPNAPLGEQYAPVHPVTLVDGGLLASLSGEQSVMVNSLHGQGVRKLADGVSVEAIADDGLVEAFSVDSATGFALAVQWHPEWRVRENPFSLKIFQAFGDACRKYAASKGDA